MSQNTIIQELLHISPTLANIPKVNVYTVDANYFATNEEKVLLAIKTDHALEVPKDYFNQLATNILTKIKDTKDSGAELDTVPNFLTAIQHNNVYTVPKNYFDETVNSIQHNISSQGISVQLAQVHNNSTLTIPEGYFKNLPYQILHKVGKNNTTKIVQLKPLNAWYKYAAAAIFISIVTIGIYQLSNKNNIHTQILEASIEKGKSMDDVKYTETLNNLTEEDIAAYLSKTSTEADVANISNSIEENNIPTETDFLTDEKTLENFLSDIQTTNSSN
jgi:hypothetical protein